MGSPGVDSPFLANLRAFNPYMLAKCLGRTKRMREKKQINERENTVHNMLKMGEKEKVKSESHTLAF